MNSYKKAYLLGFLILIGFIGGNAEAADFYIRPRAGVAAPLNGDDVYYSVGGTVGYQWISLFATEVSYLKLLGHNTAPDGSSIRGQGILSFPVGIVRPFASLGVGRLNFDVPGDDAKVTTILGGGLSVAKIAFLSAAVGVEYVIVPDDAVDYIEPYVTVGLSF